MQSGMNKIKINDMLKQLSMKKQNLENGEKLLVKSEDEYTSIIQKFYKSGTEYIVITENSIYIVANDIPTRKIS